MPWAAKGTYPGRAKNSLDMNVSNIYIKDKDKTAVIEKGLVHKGTITSVFLHLDLVTHSMKMPTLHYFIQMNWGYDTKINAICSESPDAQHCQAIFLIIFKISLSRVKSGVQFG